MCLSQGSMDSPICFGKFNRHVVRVDRRNTAVNAAFAPKATEVLRLPQSVAMCHKETNGAISELETSMDQVQVGQKSYQMPPQDGFTVAFFLTVADIERSARFYEKVFGGRILSRGDSSGAPGYIQIANTWLIVNVGVGPTTAKP